jgi:hypothetical protein
MQGVRLVKIRWKTSLALCACLAAGSPNAVLGEGSASGQPPVGSVAPDPCPFVEEILLGTGSTGPYPLAWSGLVFASESVAVDGTRVQPGLEYTVDYATGKLQFVRPLSEGHVAQVSYRYDRAQARPNVVAGRLPLDLKLWQGGAGTLQVGGQMAPAAGLRQYNMNVSYGPSRWLSFRSQVERVEALDEAQRGQARSLSSHQLTLAPLASSRLTLSRDVRATVRPDGGQNQVAVSRAQLEQKLGARSTATALVERSRASAVSGGGRVDRTAFGLTTRPSARAQFTGSYARSESTQTGRETTSSLSLATTPLPRLKLNSQFTERVSDRDGASSSLGLDWNARAGKWIGLDGGVSRKEAARVGTDDVQRLRLSLGPLSLEGQRTESDRLTGSGAEEQLLRLEAAVMSGLRLGGGRGSRVTGADHATTELSEAFVEIAPDPVFHFRGSLQSAVTGEQEALTKALSAALKAPRLLEVSSAYKSREATTGDALVSRDYVVALTPLRGFKLQGAYRENPEDKNGVVLDQLQRSLGLQSQFGFLGLSGTYSSIDAGPAAPGTTSQMELKLTLDLAAKTRFYSGYRERDSRQASLLRDRTFSLGFTRSVGSSLYLLLEGEYTLSERDGQPLDDPADARANARFGLRF